MRECASLGHGQYAPGAPPPCVMQNDFSIINRRAEENGVTEASSPVHENVGFMAYNVLAGGVLTGKYLEVAAAVDNAQDPALAEKLLENPRGRMDDYSWVGAHHRSSICLFRLTRGSLEV